MSFAACAAASNRFCAAYSISAGGFRAA